MGLADTFNKEEHDQTIIDCFLQMWRYSADLMFIMAVEADDEFSLYDNNPASKAVMGLQEGAEIHRLNLRVQFGDEMAEQVYATYRQVLQGRIPISIEQKGVRGDGSLIYFDTLFVPIFDGSGKPIFVCGVSRDISKIKEAEAVALQANEKLLEYSVALETINQELDRKVQERTKELEEAKHTVEEALEAKSSFVARMSHEIRTPINAVIGLSHLCLKSSLNIEQKDCLQTILTSGENLLGLVNDVLDFSKIEAGQLHLEAVAFSPQLLVQNAINMNALKAKEKQLTLTVEMSSVMPNKLMGDPLRIQQILVNLITNAVKFTHRGGVSVRMGIEKHDERHVLLRCDVIDSGIGISETHLGQLFQSFHQADDGITRQYGGTGLGLSISRQLCDLMGGEIWVQSELGQGSTFSFVIPLAIEAKIHTMNTNELIANSYKDSEAVEKTVPNLSKYTILLVEDNAINQKVILGYLEDTAVNVEVVYNGREAINIIQEKDFDLILMDIQMPVLDGLTASKLIRNSSMFGDKPILAMTAHVSDEARKRSAQAGMNEHLDKPIKKHDLYNILQRYLSENQSHYSLPSGNILKDDTSSLHSDFFLTLSLIDSLEVGKAVNSLGGEKIYIDLISSFCEKYTGVSLGKCTEVELFRELHSLKSNSAYIGAYKISSLCADLEQDINNAKWTLEKVEYLEKEIDSLVAKLKVSLLSPSFFIDKKRNSVFNEKELIKELEDILPLLEKSDFFVESHFSLMRVLASGSRFALDIENLIQDVRNIEFEIATIKAGQLILKLQGN